MIIEGLRVLIAVYGRSDQANTVETALIFRCGKLDDQVFELERLSRELYERQYEAAFPIATAIAKRYCAANKYYWEDPEDLANSLMERFPRIHAKYDPNNKKGIVWEKYLYWRFFFESKDYFRRSDPLGIKYPQKKKYPQWHRLGDEGLSHHQLESKKSEGVYQVDREDELTVVKEEITDTQEFRESCAVVLLELRNVCVPPVNAKPHVARARFKKSLAAKVKFEKFVVEYFSRSRQMELGF